MVPGQPLFFPAPDDATLRAVDTATRYGELVADSCDWCGSLDKRIGLFDGQWKIYCGACKRVERIWR